MTPETVHVSRSVDGWINIKHFVEYHNSDFTWIISVTRIILYRIFTSKFFFITSSRSSSADVRKFVCLIKQYRKVSNGTGKEVEAHVAKGPGLRLFRREEPVHRWWQRRVLRTMQLSIYGYAPYWRQLICDLPSPSAAWHDAHNPFGWRLRFWRHSGTGGPPSRERRVTFLELGL